MTVSTKTAASALVLSLLVAAFAVSNQSYWIDEALSLIVAQASDPSEAWKYMLAVSGSTLQMPLYQFYLYGWHKVFGDGEWIMRASNIPWFILGQLAFLLLLRARPRLALIGCLLAAVSPPIWIYLDETRSYLMQYAAAAWLTAALLALTTTAFPSTDAFGGKRIPLSAVAATSVALVVMFASSLIGVLWAGAFALALLLALRIGRVSLPMRSPALWVIGFATLALLAAFAAYYITTWQDAARGYHRAGRSLLSLPFVAYEILGFTGFGPGKIQLRTEPAASLLRSAIALLPLGATLGALGVFVLARWKPQPPASRVLAVWSLALGLPTLAICSAMFLFEHRPLPRHFIPLLPAIILSLAAVLEQAFTQKSAFWRTTAALLPALWLASSASYRWRPAHAKEDYRAAAQVAAAALANGEEVWWAADPAAAHVYQTPIALEDLPGRAWAMHAPTWESIRFKLPPDMIAVSKPDLHDPHGAVARYAEENHFVPALQLHAFTILMREGATLPALAP